MITPLTLKGFRDFLPADAIKRQYVINKIKSVFERFGFDPLETPALEYAETLLGKYGDEADKLLYLFEDNGGRKIGLRYDQTVPLARVVSQYASTLPIPFKRYQIQPVWRAENTQKGRFREFLQCDADIVGSFSPLVDAEIIVCAIKAIEELGFKNYKIKVNDRNALYDSFQKAGFKQGQNQFVARELDKLDKKPQELVFTNLYLETRSIGSTATVAGPINSLKDYDSRGTAVTISDWLQKGANTLGVPSLSALPTVDNIHSELKQIKTKVDTIQYVSEYRNPEGPAVVKNLKSILKNMGVNEDKVSYERNLARGLDYYTGLIFEVEIEEYEAGSVCGGGRYDKLIGSFTGNDVPAVGFAFGFDRLLEALDQMNLLPAVPTTTSILVTVFSENLLPKSLALTSRLRNEGINTEVALEASKLDKQLKYADRKGIPYVIIQGPEEVSKGVVKIKDMKAKTQKELTMEAVIKQLSKDE